MPMPMPAPLPDHGRIDLGDLKSQIIRRLGPDRARCYFSYLNRLLAQKLSKLEFQRFCLSALGHENIPLHNQLVLSILKNACLAKAAPPPAPPKPVGKKLDRGLCPSLAPAMPMSVWSNGDLLPSSPRKVRSSIRDRRIKDCPSSLGPTAKADVGIPQNSDPTDGVIVRENGGMNLCDLKRPVQQFQDGRAEQLVKRPRADELSPHDRDLVHTKSLVKATAVEEREEAGHVSDLNSSRGPVQAPLGIPFCSASVGGAMRSLPLVSVGSIGSFSNNFDSGELFETEELRRCMGKIAEAQGLGEVTMDCANLLNNVLDAYLKRLVKSCVELVGACSTHNPIDRTVFKQQTHGKQINGFRPANHIHSQSSDKSSEDQHEKDQCSISLNDFKVAMELNPQQLGEDWPLLLDKIYFCSFEE